jgi:hypothetical protein
MLINTFIPERTSFYTHDIVAGNKVCGRAYGMYVEVSTGMWHIYFNTYGNTYRPQIMCNFAGKVSERDLRTLHMMRAQARLAASLSEFYPDCDYGRWGTKYKYGASWETNWLKLWGDYREDVKSLPELPWKSLAQLHTRISPSAFKEGQSC